MTNIEGMIRLRQGYGAAGEAQLTKTAVNKWNTFSTFGFNSSFAIRHSSFK